MALTSEEKLDAKIANEKTKLFATLANGLAGGTALAGIVTPILVYKQLDMWWGGFSVGGAFVLHLLARLIVCDLQPEE